MNNIINSNELLILSRHLIWKMIQLTYYFVLEPI